jgi:hypothetical protein
MLALIIPLGRLRVRANASAGPHPNLLPARLRRNVILRSGATKNLLLSFGYDADSTRLQEKSRSFATAQDDAGAIFRIATQSQREKGIDPQDVTGN